MTVMLAVEKENILKDFLNIQELSQLLGIKVSTLYTLVEEKRVPHYRIGRLIRFKRSEIELWMGEQRQACVDIGKEARRILNPARCPAKSIDEVIKKAIEQARTEGYTNFCGKPDRIKGRRKEVEDGAL
jgi:excisionase family DNA binding protein